MAKDKASMKDIVLAAAVAVCGQPPKTITPEQYAKILGKTRRRKVKGRAITRERVNHHLRAGGYMRALRAGQDPRVKKVIEAAYKEVQKTEDPATVLLLKERLVNDVAAVARAHGLSPLKWGSIRNVASKEGYGSWPNVSSTAATKRVIKERGEVSDETIARFMNEGRSYREVSLKFTLPIDDVEKRLREGLEGYDLFEGPLNLKSEQTYTAVPKTGNDPKLKRVWSHRASSIPGQPYIGIDFPDDFNHKKLRIVPIDGIMYGHEDFDEQRFRETIRFIQRSPQTFCFLNGAIIAPVVGGKRDVKNALLIERGLQCEELLKPIAHKILWAQQGLPERNALKQQRFDPLKHLCERFDNIPYFTEPVHADICWRGHLWHIFAIHGQSAAQKKGSKLNAIRGVSEFQDFTHFYVMGRLGDAMWNRNVIIDRNTRAMGLQEKEEFHVILSNFLKYLGTDRARKGYAPSTKDTVLLYVYPDGEYHVKTRTGGR